MLCLQLCLEEKHLKTYNITNSDEQQQQKTEEDQVPGRQKQEFETTVGTGSLKLDSWLEKL